MPGRQGNGPLGGGGRSGGGGFGGFGGGGNGGFGGGGNGGFGGGGNGGFGGGGFRGGGGGGGGYRGGWGGGGYRGGWGGGYGGGWRPRFFGGWGIPLFIGSRFGGWGGGGIGCGLVALVIIGFVVLGGVGSVFNGSNNYNTNNSGSNSSNGSNGTSNGSNGGGLLNQPAPVQTQTAIDLAELHTALDNRIPTWQSSLANNQEIHIPAGDAGMANDNNIKDIVYGKCGSAFFIFVVDKGTPTNAGSATSAGYAYTTASSPATCHPSQYQVTDSEDDGGGWYFVYLTG